MSFEPIHNATNTTVDLASLERTLVATKELLGISRPIAVRLMDDAEMIDLNTRFRQVESSTDVLTFPSGLADPLPLGDIAICVPYGEAQAALRGVSLDDELSALLVHGCLHLVGYDDVEDEDKAAMQAKMNEIGEKLGIPIDAEWTSVLHQAHDSARTER
ncbi:MAG: rRNA maturation RNase YbeY [Armatimonadetes bacterium]|nr:rRNA maturation RNase YbeY [Armatimonadota bacterium]